MCWIDTVASVNRECCGLFPDWDDVKGRLDTFFVEIRPHQSDFATQAVTVFKILFLCFPLVNERE